MFDDKIKFAVKLFEKPIDVSVRFYGDSRQIDRREAEIAAFRRNFLLRIVDVADDPSAATHVGDFGFVTLRNIVFEIERGVKEREVREKPFCTDPAGELE